MDANTNFQKKEYLVLREWNGQNYFNWNDLSGNPNAIHLLEANPDRIDWNVLSGNPNAIHLLEAKPDKINWHLLSGNPNAIHLLEVNRDKIDWYWLSGNPNAIHLLEANLEKIDWNKLSDNPKAIHLLEVNQDKIDWYRLSYNFNAIKLIEANLDNINWFILSYNPNATHLLRNNKHRILSNFNDRILNGYSNILYDIQYDGNKINWNMLSPDIESAQIIKAHFDFDLSKSSANPNIFTYNYEKIKQEHEWLTQGLIEYFHHPRFIEKWLNEGNELEDYLM